MRGAKPVETLDKVFGKNKWGKAPVPPCKKLLGYRKVHIKKSSRRKAHMRNVPVTEHHKRCHCTLPANTMTAKIMDLNPCENLFNLVEQELKKIAGIKGWPKSKNQLIERIKFILDNIDVSWFENIFSSLPKRWKSVISKRGKNTDYFVRKYD